MSTGLIAHEWLAPAGGSERVVEAMIDAFPGAPLHVLWDDAPHIDRGAPVRESWLARTPLRRSKGAALPLMPAVWKRLRSSADVDWILASSHAFAHHARLSGAPHVPTLAYVHTPARYVWLPELDTRGNSRLARAASVPLRSLDHRRAQDLEAVAANSAYVARRIADCWERDATVIYPPVDVAQIMAADGTELDDDERALLESLPAAFVLGASRFVPYKEVHQALRVGQLLDTPVVLAGGGPGEAELREEAEALGVAASFVIDPSTPLLRALYARALLYVFLAVEDFGIMPVEAMAAGTPVLVRSEGGAVESVLSCEGGAAVDDPADTVELKAAAHRAMGIDRAGLPARTMRFDRSRFIGEIRDWVERGGADV